MATSETLKPDDIAYPDPWPCWSADGWEDAAEWSMQDATKVTRAQARHRATWDHRWTEIGVWKRYIRLLTRQESYDYNASDSAVWRWCDSFDPPLRWQDGGWRQTPNGAVHSVPETLAVVPPDWQPQEADPVWEFVHRSHPDARPYWVVGLQADGPPPNPKAVSADA